MSLFSFSFLFFFPQGITYLNLFSLFLFHVYINSLAEIDLPYFTTEITTASSPFAVSLAKHLNSIGAKMYGAFWCSHCLEQKQVHTGFLFFIWRREGVLFKLKHRTWCRIMFINRKVSSSASLISIPKFWKDFSRHAM